MCPHRCRRREGRHREGRAQRSGGSREEARGVPAAEEAAPTGVPAAEEAAPTGVPAAEEAAPTAERAAAEAAPAERAAAEGARTRVPAAAEAAPDRWARRPPTRSRPRPTRPARARTRRARAPTYEDQCVRSQKPPSLTGSHRTLQSYPREGVANPAKMSRLPPAADRRASPTKNAPTPIRAAPASTSTMLWAPLMENIPTSSPPDRGAAELHDGEAGRPALAAAMQATATGSTSRSPRTASTFVRSPGSNGAGSSGADGGAPLAGAAAPAAQAAPAGPGPAAGRWAERQPPGVPATYAPSARALAQSARGREDETSSPPPGLPVPPRLTPDSSIIPPRRPRYPSRPAALPSSIAAHPPWSRSLGGRDTRPPPT
jgi:hypothetical protein